MFSKRRVRIVFLLKATSTNSSAARTICLIRSGTRGEKFTFISLWLTAPNREPDGHTRDRARLSRRLATSAHLQACCPRFLNTTLSRESKTPLFSKLHGQTFGRWNALNCNPKDTTRRKGDFMASPTKNISKSVTLPAPNSDFYQLAETLPPEELAILRQVRAFMEAKVAPIINKYWIEDSFPFELLPAFKELNIGGIGLKG